MAGLNCDSSSTCVKTEFIFILKIDRLIYFLYSFVKKER